MGLDMYLTRITRLTDDEKKLVEHEDFDAFANDFMEIELTNPDESEITREGIEDIMPYLHVVEKQRKYFNVDRLKKHFGIPDEAEIGMQRYSSDGALWEFCIYKENKKFTMDFNKIKGMEDQFVDINTVKCGYCKRDDIIDWRKDYDLDKALCMAYDGEVVNCGYHRLNDKMREIILKHEDGKLTSDDIEDTENSVVCYHQWY